MEKPEDPWVTETGSRIKAWYVLRADLGMSEGKLAIQVGHATDLIHMEGDANPFYRDWLDEHGGNRRKILLRAKTLSDLEKVRTACVDAGMIVKDIWDAGLTEFGRATHTGIVILPHDDTNQPKLLKRSQNWKTAAPEPA